MKQKVKLGRPLSLVSTTITIFMFTILAHHLSIELVGNNLVDTMKTFQITQELPSALAQTTTPIPTPTPTPTPTPISEQTVFFLLVIVLIGVLVLLFTLLSPVVGFFGHWAPGHLNDKARFLTETFPKLLEGVTVVLIVMVVTVLTLAGYVNQQGTISILSALIGYVLGRKASELEFKEPPNKPSETPTSLSIKPEKTEVKFGEEVKIEIEPAQELEHDNVQVEPQGIGSVRIQDKSTLVYTAPSQPEAGNTTEVTITARSKNLSIPPATTKINIIP